MSADRNTPERPAGRSATEDEAARPTRDRRPTTRPLPHERDQTPRSGPAEVTGPRQVTEQAARDVARGLRDTDRHGTPSDVPGPGPQPENTEGAEVPEQGVDRDK